MADLEKTVKIIFEGEDKSLTGSATQLAGKFENLSFVAGQITEPLAKVADGVLKVDAALAALVVGGMALAIKASSDFNQGFALISTSVDATGGDLTKYRDQVLSYSESSVKSITDINAALYTAAQAGIKWGDSLEFMGKAEQLAVANNANLNTTVDLLTGTMNAYGYSVKDVGHLNDVFFTSTLIGKQTIDSLGQSMGQVVGIAANFGVSFESLSAAIATLTAKGMETSEAITAVKGVITTIVQPSQEAAKAAAALGLDFSASALKARGFEGIIADVMKATGGSADKMATLFNEVRALNGAMQLTGDGMAFFNKALDQIQNSTGSSAAAYEKMVATFRNQSQMLANIAQVLLIDVGTKLEASGAGIAGSIGDLLKGIHTAIEQGAFDPLFASLNEASKGLSAWFAGVAKALPEAMKGLDFSKLISAVKDLGGAFGEYLGNLDLTDVEDLHEFIQKIIDGIAGLIKVTEGMVEGFRPFFTAIADFLLTMADSDEETKKMTGTILALSKAAESMGLGLVAAVKAMEEYGASVSGVFNTIAGGSQIMWNGLQILFDGIGMAIILLEKTFLQFLDSLSLGALGKFSTTFQNMRDTVEESGMKIRESFLQNGEDAGRGLDKMINGLSNLGGQAEQTQEKVSVANKEMANIPEKKQTLWQFEGADEIKQAISDIGKDVVVVEEKVNKAFPKDDERYIVVGYIEDENGRTELTQKINSAIPKEKSIDVKLNAESVKANADIIQKSIEWKAKIDIANIEAGTKQIEAAFKSVDNTITSTGTTMTSFVDSYVELYKSGQGVSSTLEDLIEAEAERRDGALELQKKLVEAQIDNLNARTDALRSGSAMIQIDGAGLQPHLEAFMFEILAAIQIRANAEGAQLLVGTGV
ncbi:MAG: phage tail tape measure protein [Smithella sp.]